MISTNMKQTRLSASVIKPSDSSVCADGGLGLLAWTKEGELTRHTLSSVNCFLVLETRRLCTGITPASALLGFGKRVLLVDDPRGPKARANGRDEIDTTVDIMNLRMKTPIKPFWTRFGNHRALPFPIVSCHDSHSFEFALPLSRSVFAIGTHIGIGFGCHQLHPEKSPCSLESFFRLVRIKK